MNMHETKLCPNCNTKRYLFEFKRRFKSKKTNSICRYCLKEHADKNKINRFMEKEDGKELTRLGRLIRKRRKIVLAKLGNKCNCGFADSSALFVVRKDGQASKVKFSGDGLLRKMSEILEGLPEMEIRCSNCQLIKLYGKPASRE